MIEDYSLQNLDYDVSISKKSSVPNEVHLDEEQRLLFLLLLFNLEHLQARAVLDQHLIFRLVVRTKLSFVHFEAPPGPVNCNFNYYRFFFYGDILESILNSRFLVNLCAREALQIHSSFFQGELFVVFDVFFGQGESAPNFELAEDGIAPPAI